MAQPNLRHLMMMRRIMVMMVMMVMVLMTNVMVLNDASADSAPRENALANFAEGFVGSLAA